MHWRLGNSQLPPGKSHITILAAKRDSSQGGCSVVSKIQGQNPTPSSLLNHSQIADITQHVTSTLSNTQRLSINTTTTMPGTWSHCTPALAGTSQTVSTCRIVSNPISGIYSTPTPLRGLENLPTPIPDLEDSAIITNRLRTRATETNQRQRQWQLQLQAVSTPRSVVSGSRSIYRFGHSDMTCLAFAMGRPLELFMWNLKPFMSASNLEMVSYATRRIAKASAEASHLQIIGKYWNTAMQQNNIQSIAFEARTQELFKEVCWSNGRCWILHTQTGTRFEHKSLRFNPILFIYWATT